MYRCAVCNAPIVVVVDKGREVRVRSCVHTAAPIVAEMTARMEGRGGLR